MMTGWSVRGARSQLAGPRTSWRGTSASTPHSSLVITAMCSSGFPGKSRLQTTYHTVSTPIGTYMYVPLLVTGLLSECEGLGCSFHARPARIENTHHCLASLCRFPYYVFLHRKATSVSKCDNCVFCRI